MKNDKDSNHNLNFGNSFRSSSKQMFINVINRLLVYLRMHFEDKFVQIQGEIRVYSIIHNFKTNYPSRVDIMLLLTYVWKEDMPVIPLFYSTITTQLYSCY